MRPRTEAAGGIAVEAVRPCRLEPDQDLRWLNERTVVGGSPTRQVRLSPSAGKRLRELLDGAAPRQSEAELVRGLLAAGIVHPRFDRFEPTTSLITFVVPFHGNPNSLPPLLEALPRDTRVIVVDDASPIPARVAAENVEVIRHDVNRGPAAARNTGWRRVTTPFVGFLDADTRPGPTWHQHLIGHFADRQMAVVAPRIRSVSGDGLLQRLEEACNPLDMGRSAGLVQRWSRLPYVPSAAWVTRRAALEDVGGFDESMRLAEDVDLVWRLESRGWRVRYDPAVEVLHCPRDGWRDALRQRHQYGRSSGRLWRGHPRRFRHLEVTPHAAIPWLAAVAIGPSAGALASLASAVAVVHRSTLPALSAARLAAGAQRRAGVHLAAYARRIVLPIVAAAAAAGSRPARRALAASLTPYLADWLSQRPHVDVLRYVAYRLACDLGYGSGVWRGAIEERSWGPVAARVLTSAHFAADRE